MKLTSTQIGAIAENLVANELMIESGGRLSPFQPIADDDGIDLLVYDKVTGNALPIQVKARTNTIKKSGKQERSNTAHFEVRKATFKDTRSAILLCVLLKPDLRSSERTWVMPLEHLATLTAEKELKFVIRANKTLGSKDKYSSFQCESMKHVAERLIQICES